MHMSVLHDAYHSCRNHENVSYERKANMAPFTEVKVWRSIFYLISSFICPFLNKSLHQGMI